MDIEAALRLADALVFAQTGRHLDNLQSAIFREAWQGKSFTDIAETCHCNESYAKDVGSKLWKVLSSALGETVGKRNFKAALERRWKAEQSGLISSSQASGLDSVQPSAPDPNFVGRERAIADLNTLVSQGKKVILIQAEGGVGKTTLAYRYLYTQRFDKVLELRMAKERRNINPVESIIEEWLKRDFDEEPGRDFSINLERLRRKLQDANQRTGVIIDNLEPALENGRFIANHCSHTELLRTLAHPTVQSVTLITSREPLYEVGSSIWLYPLKGLSKKTWNQVFETYGINTGSSALSDASALYQMHQAYGGNAEAMLVLSGAIQIESQGDLEAYWEENQEDLLLNPTLENLVKSQFNKLQEDDEQAYQLLCRLGCFRYQDVPSVPQEGVFCLLWDVPQKRHKRVAKALRDRSLVKACKGEYYLHPVIRAEAIERLRKSEDWQTANLRAAEFWRKSIKTVETVEDALVAFEAYNHYFEINDFEQAARVILEVRNHNNPSEHLGYACWRLGLWQQVISSISRVIDKINNAYFLSTFNRILGYSYHLLGNLHEAIKYHEESARVANLYLNSIPSKSLVDRSYGQIGDMLFAYWINIGVVRLDLWELTEAIKAFEKGLLLAENNNSHLPLIQGYFLVALVKSYLGFKEEAYILIENANSNLLSPRINISQWSTWSRGYNLLLIGKTYKNLGEIEKSFKMYRSAIVYAEKNHYSLVRAKALTGLAELYREHQDFKTALLHHSEAIKILDTTGAKCDIAESCYQLGLTYTKMDEAEKSQDNFEKAIQLFTEMEAPKQVERVRWSMVDKG